MPVCLQQLEQRREGGLGSRVSRLEGRDQDPSTSFFPSPSSTNLLCLQEPNHFTSALLGSVSLPPQTP